MVYKIKQDKEGLMLYESSEPKPKMYGYGYNDYTLKAWNESFKLLCPIYSGHVDRFTEYVIKNNGVNTGSQISQMLHEGVEIPVTRFVIDASCCQCGELTDKCSHSGKITLCAIFKPEITFDEDQAMLVKELMMTYWETVDKKGFTGVLDKFIIKRK